MVRGEIPRRHHPLLPLSVMKQPPRSEPPIQSYVCMCMNERTVTKGAEEEAKAGGRKAGSRRSVRPKLHLEHPDVTPAEFTIRRSFRIQDGIERFLEENADSSWDSLTEMYIRAANYVFHTGLLKRRPSLVTAQRWISQYTAVGEEYRIQEVRGEGYWILSRRGKP